MPFQHSGLVIILFLFFLSHLVDFPLRSALFGVMRGGGSSGHYALRTVCQPQGLTFGSAVGPVAFIMPVAEEGTCGYANVGQSEVSYEGENPD